MTSEKRDRVHVGIPSKDGASDSYPVELECCWPPGWRRGQDEASEKTPGLGTRRSGGESVLSSGGVFEAWRSQRLEGGVQGWVRGKGIP